MSEENKLAVQLIREMLAAAPDDETRKAMFDEIMEGYCKECGRDDSDDIRGCQCWNDE